MPEFVKRNKKSKSLETIIRDEDKRKSVPLINGSFEPSRITECSRRILYRSIGTSYESQTRYIDSLSDRDTINRWIDILDGCLNLHVLGRDIVSADSKYNITINVNALISLDDCSCVTKIQPVCSNDFNNITKNGAEKKDVVELIICLWLMELKDGLILYSNNDNNDHVVFHVGAYTPVINAVKSKCELMVRHKIDGTLPERPYKDDSSWECKSCEFKNKCWRADNHD